METLCTIFPTFCKSKVIPNFQISKFIFFEKQTNIREKTGIPMNTINCLKRNGKERVKELKRRKKSFPKSFDFLHKSKIIPRTIMKINKRADSKFAKQEIDTKN